MALLFVDGFDHSGTSVAIHTTKWTTWTGSAGIVTSPVRTGTGAARVSFGSSNSVLTKVLPTSVPSGTTLTIGFAFYKGANHSATRELCVLQESATTHLGLALTATGLLCVFRGTTATILQTGTTVLANTNWYYLEFQAVVHDTTGAYAVRIDGVAEISGSPVDTRNAGTAGTIDRFFLQGATAAGADWYVDDLYVCDGTGALHTTFLGPCKVETLLPQTGNGSNVGLTPSTGTDHGALVDENPPNTTDYNSSPTVGLKDTYHYPSLTLTGTILAVQTNLYISKSDAAARQVCAVVRAGGVDYDGANVAPTTTFSYFCEPRALNPNTGAAWTPADVTALEAGMKVTV